MVWTDGELQDGENELALAFSLSQLSLKRIDCCERHVGGSRCWICPAFNATLHCARAVGTCCTQSRAISDCCALH